MQGCDDAKLQLKQPNLGLDFLQCNIACIVTSSRWCCVPGTPGFPLILPGCLIAYT